LNGIAHPWQAPAPASQSTNVLWPPLAHSPRRLLRLCSQVAGHLPALLHSSLVFSLHAQDPAPLPLSVIQSSGILPSFKSILTCLPH